MSVLIADNGTLMQFVPNVLKCVQRRLHRTWRWRSNGLLQLSFRKGF